MQKRYRNSGALVGLAFAGLALSGLALWLIRRQPEQAPKPAELASSRSWADSWLPEDALDLPPDSGAFEPAALGDASITARPQSHSTARWTDDYETIGPDDLGAAFLARATETSETLTEVELDPADEMPGFQISTPDTSGAAEDEQDRDDVAFAEIFDRARS